MKETATAATAEEVQDEVATMGLDAKPDSEITGESEVRHSVLNSTSKPPV